jgi:uncharacterized coiled-coil DUF342 family protein
MPIIIDETRQDDPAFMKAQIYALKENLTNCHNELQMVYGELNNAKKQIKALKVELSIHGVELK